MIVILRDQRPDLPAARGARAAGLTRVLEFAEVEAAAAAVKQFVKQGDVLLLKASRATRLERHVQMTDARSSDLRRRGRAHGPHALQGASR